MAGKSTDGDEVKDSDSLVALSLGAIYGNAPVARALADDGFCSPVTPTMPVLPRPVDLLGALSAAATVVHPPPRFAASVVVQGNGNDAFLAAGVLTPTQMASALTPLLPPLFPSDGSNGAVPVPIDGSAAAPIPVRGTGITPAPTQLKRVLPSATSHPSKELSAPPPKCPRITGRSTRRRPRTAGCSNGGGTSGHATSTTNSNGPLPADGVDDAGSNEVPINGGLLLCPPFPWATNRVGMHHSLAELSKRGIVTIKGEAECKRCNVCIEIVFDIQTKFMELYDFITRNVQSMNDRAPSRWSSPTLPDCEKCGQRNSVRPVISTDKDRINWVFLLLGEMVGLCTLEQLKHFCAYTGQHRTGAKDRVLYSTYMELCDQLLPNGLFDVAAERQKRSLPHA